MNYSACHFLSCEWMSHPLCQVCIHLPPPHLILSWVHSAVRSRAARRLCALSCPFSSCMATELQPALIPHRAPWDSQGEQWLRQQQIQRRSPEELNGWQHEQSSGKSECAVPGGRELVWAGAGWKTVPTLPACITQWPDLRFQQHLTLE